MCVCVCVCPELLFMCVEFSFHFKYIMATTATTFVTATVHDPVTTCQFKRILAVDNSGSTRDKKLYHDVVLSELLKLPNDASTGIFLWNTTGSFVTRDELLRTNAYRLGGGGTNPFLVMQTCITHAFKGHLILITDGQVTPADVDVVDALVASQPIPWSFERVDAHIVSTNPNTSVTVPFVRASPHTMVLHGDNLNGSVDTSCTVAAVSAADIQAVAALDSIDSRDAFFAAYDALHRALAAAMAGTTGNAVTRDRLIEMRARIVRNEATAASALVDPDPLGSVHTASPWLDALLARDEPAALEFMRQAYTAQFTTAGTGTGTTIARDFETQVSRLVSMCSGALRSEFDMGVIKSQAFARAPQVALGVPIQDLIDEGTSNADAARELGRAVTCPILMADGSDLVLLLAQPKTRAPLLAALDTRTVSMATENPLSLLHNDAFKKALADSLDATLSLACLQLATKSGHPMTQSPLTRRPLCGAVVMGADLQHVLTTNAALAALITGGKRLGNPDLWYAVLYFVVAESLMLQERAPELLFGLATQLQWRLLNRTSFASLGGDTTRLCVRVPLAVALWHVTHACLLQSELGTRASEEPLRAHLFSFGTYNTMLRMVGIEYNPQAFVHAQHLQALTVMLSACKRDVWFFLKVKALYQRSLCLCATSSNNLPLVLLDGPVLPTDVESRLGLLPQNIQALALTVEEIDGLASMCSPQFSFKNIELGFPWNPPTSAATPVVNWTLQGVFKVTISQVYFSFYLFLSVCRVYSCTRVSQDMPSVFKRVARWRACAMANRLGKGIWTTGKPAHDTAHVGASGDQVPGFSRELF